MESLTLIDTIPTLFAFFGIIFFFLYLRERSEKEAYKFKYKMTSEELSIKNIKVDELRRNLKESQENLTKAKSKIKKLNRKLENMNAEHIISPNNINKQTNNNSYNGVSRYKMKQFISNNRTSNFASSIPKDSELDGLDIMTLYMYYTLLNNAINDNNESDSTPSITTNTDPSEPDTVIDYKEAEPSFIDKSIDAVNDITSPITTPVMGVVNEAFNTRDKMIDTTFGTLNELNDAKNEAITNVVTPVVDKAEEIRDNLIDGASNAVEKIKGNAVELNHTVNDIEKYSSNHNTVSDEYGQITSISNKEYADKLLYGENTIGNYDSSSSDNDDSYSSSSSSYSDSSSDDYSSSSSSSSYSSYDSGSSCSSSSSSWDSGSSSSYDSGSSGGDW